jgi:Glycine-zipper domain
MVRCRSMVRFVLALGIAFWVVAAPPGFAVAQYRAYYPPPGYGPPPCSAVTRGPFRGAARGAAGGALFGAIGGNAGRGAAIGAAVGGVGGAIRRGTARSSGACY